ncbi:peptidase [Frateuria sp. Soil773]|uniref:PepSY-associated TM helix domain-containing protein n=1 Tax=Frateuria sp. Soil773 TaxID=1736407 RepID=UPI0006F384FE|nr:PepSY-associated TM helix domain-containing protein [Frateuria sp. Soil773]KRE89506.1 peptidase [Frateuria sp. Soil773]
MKGGLRQSMAWLHTWSGLLVGWLLFGIFVTGTSAYFQQEITRWMQPEARGQATPEEAVHGAVRYLEKVAPKAQSWYITLPGARGNTTQLFWYPGAGDDEDTSAVLDGRGERVDLRDTQGGYFLYRFHFDLHYIPVIWARWIVGFCAMLMLVAILSGIVTHKKIFTDFFTLRLQKGQRSWLDAHNVSAVLGLPFHLMITYTGLVTLATLYMPWGIAANYKNPQTFYDTLYTPVASTERSADAPLTDLAPLLRRASARWNGAQAELIGVTLPGDRAATVTLTRAAADGIPSRGETMTFDGATGAWLADNPPRGGAMLTESAMIGLHAGRYASMPLRWLYFFCGLGGSAMVATGLVLWTVKRRQQLPDPTRPHLGFRLVERLNIATVAGLPAGIAGYFLANRLLPLAMAHRADWEIHTIFLTWGAALLWAVCRPPKRAWVETLTAAATLFACVPVVNALTTPRNLVASLLERDWVFAGFDGVMLLLAAVFATAAWRAARHRPRPRPARHAAGAEA